MNNSGLYNAERKSEEEIDKIAEKYKKLHDRLTAENDYNTILRHLDYKGLLTQCKHLFKFGKNIQYEQQVFTFLNSVEGDAVLEKIRSQYLSEIKV